LPGHTDTRCGNDEVPRAARADRCARRTGCAYTANAAGGSVSGFSIAADGSIALLDSNGVSAAIGADSHPLDETVSADGRYLYVLVDGHHTIGGYRIAADGSLTPLGEAGTLPAGAVGLASS